LRRIKAVVQLSSMVAVHLASWPSPPPLPPHAPAQAASDDQEVPTPPPAAPPLFAPSQYAPPPPHYEPPPPHHSQLAEITAWAQEVWATPPFIDLGSNDEEDDDA
jgi:hypothetical protein